MARVSAAGGGYGGGATVVPTDSSHSDYVSVPDAELIFRGDYHRAGPDLVLTGQDGRHHIIPGYFASEKHPALMAPSGANLPGDVVDLLAGSPAPGHYAQAQPAGPADSIGKVDKIVGDVTVLRNGVSVALHVGDAVFKSDVIATGANSSAGITFPDGTLLDLVANSRMALNEYAFETNGTDNNALFTLVEGTFGFVAGKVAHDNHMSVVTPVATMGIRGTAGIVRHEFRANAGDLIYSFLVLDEIEIRHHGHHVGSYVVRDNGQNSPSFDEILKFIDDSGYVTYIQAQGAGQPPLVTTEVITNSRLFDDRPILNNLIDSYAQWNGPGGLHGQGSGDNPNQLFGPQFFNENNGLPFTFNFQGSGGNGAGSVNINLTVPVQPDVPPPPPPPPPPSSNVFIWDGGPGTYPTQNWSQPGVPNSSNDIVEILSGTVTYPAGDNFTIAELIVGPGATLDIVGGTLNVLNGIIDDGTIIVEGDPPTLKTGPTTIGSAGSFIATGSGDEIEFTGDVSNSGLLKAAAGGELLFDTIVVNEPGGTRKSAGIITSTGAGSTINFDGDVFNFGTVSATHGGMIAFDGGTFVNEAAGTDQVAGLMVSRGEGSEIEFTNNTIDNLGVMLATHRGEIIVDSSDVNNDAGGFIGAIGRGSRIVTTDSSFDNFGTAAAAYFGTLVLKSTTVTNESGGVFGALDGGKIIFDGDLVTNLSGGKIAALGCDSLVVLKNGEFDNSGLAAAKDGGAIKFVGEMVVNEAGSGSGAASAESGDGTISGGKIEAADRGFIEFAGGGVENQSGAVIEARDHGVIVFKSIEGNPISVTNDSGGQMMATDHGIMVFKDVGLFNDAGATIEAKDHGIVKFIETADSTAGIMNEGTIAARDHGIVTFIDVGAGESGGIVNTGGTIAAFGWGSSVDFYDSTIIGGTLNADGGKIFVSSDSSLVGPISVLISDHGIADFANVVTPADHLSVTFSGTGGTFEVDPEAGSVATVTGFGVGDTIDLTNFKFSPHETVHYCDGVLTVTDCGSSESFTLVGSYSANDFVLLSDPWGGTEIVFGQKDYWNSCEGGSWTACFDWSGGVPGVDNTAIIDKPVTVTLADCEQVGNLVIGDQCAALDIVGGGLKVINALDDSGQIVVSANEEDPYLQVGGPVRVEVGGSMTAQGSGASIEFFHDQVGNAGCITACDLGDITFEALVWNEGGRIEAKFGGLISFADSTVTNDFCATIDADGCFSTVDFSWSTISNDGRIDAEYRGIVDLDHATVTQGCDGVLAALGEGSVVELSNATIHGGTLETGNPYSDNCGVIDIVSPGDGGANISVFDGTDCPVVIDGFVRVEGGANLELMGTIHLGNGETGGTIDVDTGPASGANLVIDGEVHLYGSGTVTLDGSSDAIIGASCDGGTLDNAVSIIGTGHIGDGSNDLTLINEQCGVIGATGGDAGPLVIDTGCNTVVNNGLMQATCSSELDIHSNLFNAGTLAADNGIVNVAGAVFGTGSDTISHGGLLEFQSFVSAGQTITFADPGTLRVDDSADFHAGIGGFGPQDTIDLTDIAFSAGESAVWTQVSTANGGAGTLQIFNGSTLEDTLNLNGIYTQGEFALAQDNTASHGTDVNFNYISFNTGEINFVDDHNVGYLGPQASPDGSALTLTDGKMDEHGSWFATNKVSVDSFTASFDYQANGAADGVAFILQDDPRGAAALGDGGSALGYGGSDAISPSAAVELNIFDVKGTAFATDGGTGGYNSTLPVDFWDTGDKIQVVLTYDGSTLTEALTDTVTGNTFSTNYNVDLASILGSDSAFVGFSGATGLAASTQTVSNFNFEDGPVAIDSANNAAVPNPQNSAQTMTGATLVLVGGPGNDNFVFQPGSCGAGASINSNPQSDTIELDHFANLQNAQQLAALITPDSHGDAPIDLGHSDGIALGGVTSGCLHAQLQSFAHLA
jgi:Legume lectin domain/FecR protein